MICSRPDWQSVGEWVRVWVSASHSVLIPLRIMPLCYNYTFFYGSHFEQTKLLYFMVTNNATRALLWQWPLELWHKWNMFFNMEYFLWFIQHAWGKLSCCSDRHINSYITKMKCQMSKRDIFYLYLEDNRFVWGECIYTCIYLCAYS